MRRLVYLALLIFVGAGVAISLAVAGGGGGAGGSTGRPASARAPPRREREVAREGAKGKRAERDREQRAGHAHGSLGGLFSGPREQEPAVRRPVPATPSPSPTSPRRTRAIVSRDRRPRHARSSRAPTAPRSRRGRRAARRRRRLDSPTATTPLFGNRTAVRHDQRLDERGPRRPLRPRHRASPATASGRLYAAASNGGVWKSTDGGASWTSIGDGPARPRSSPASPGRSAGGGTLVVLTGDNAFGGDTYAGQGVYRTSDGGATGRTPPASPTACSASSSPSTPPNAEDVYAATGGGLFRSTDAGATFANVRPADRRGRPAGTPDCAGKPTTAKDCFLANMVTDVVVQGAANAQTRGGKPGAVLAAVGWRAGTKQNADGAQQSPGNGIYSSPTGAPGTFTNLDIGRATRPRGHRPAHTRRGSAASRSASPTARSRTTASSTRSSRTP